ncbi:MAG: hypothetical protein ABSG43_11405 [Solirubrobacteraceae bacterium]|jgi:hypothetical protein
MATDPITALAAELARYQANIDRLASWIDDTPQLLDTPAVDRLAAPAHQLAVALERLQHALDRAALLTP